ncbi:related to tetrahydrofolylpolyglutamate synthase [Ramularia collo-cygni]|uniref:tetrahydrofolate synthase n=1 Tax=Ramularia collo-cygni TaxID=112498 RepID=A0A2D3V3Q1_9PEZI|nr:related to tetrahydrofolylpolyglutamate synthase [Ramularia collo-cygni]CZT16129.1 related to tetrahydrofolylpolyglutamate synthase [Ramularia collo-cygni]
MERTYENALHVLASRRRGGRPPNTSSESDPSGTVGLRGTPSLIGMREWLDMLGHSADDLRALNIIHIAGTKGKGSTCAFTESILRSHGERTGKPSKTGLYSSPHLILPEERIRINSKPLERHLLAKYFFEVYDLLPQLASPYDPSKEVVERGPRYLQLWALLGLHVFIRERVDCTIFETHHGGEYDATNVAPRPVVTAITTLGMDHIDVLGPTIRNIAWHKSGIYKPGSVALSTIQSEEPAEVLTERAQAQGETVRFVDLDPRLPKNAPQIQPSVQKKNSSLAIAIAEASLEKTVNASSPSHLTSEDIEHGISRFSWPGRFHIVSGGSHTWFLDAAHNEMSVAIAADWFTEVGSEMAKQSTDISRTLIFSHINETRDAVGLLKSLAQSLKDSGVQVSDVIFSTYDEIETTGSGSPPKSPDSFCRVWEQYFPDSSMRNEPTILGAMTLAARLGRERGTQHTLVTGSQHLVGPALQVLKRWGLEV